MGLPATRMGDLVLQTGPHYHAPMPLAIFGEASTVLIGKKPAAQVGDQTSHVACVGPIPGPLGKLVPPGCPTVLIG